MAIRWGLLSTARINDVIIDGCRGSESVAIHAVASRDLARAEEYAERRGIPHAYGSYEQLLGADDVDAVYISLPNALHMPWSVAALEAGKHVLCEKPLSRAPRSVATAFDVAADRGLLLREAFMYRWHAQTDRIRDLVASGAIGELAFLRSSHSFAMVDRDNDARMDPDLDGGALLDLGCYGVSVARLLAGEPESVFAWRDAQAEVDVRFHGMLRFPGDVVAQFDCGMDLPLRNGLEVVGTRGAIAVPDPWHCRDTRFTLQTAAGSETIEIPAADPYRVQLERFGAGIEGREELPFGREDAVAQALTLSALAEAAEQRTVVALGSMVA